MTDTPSLETLTQALLAAARRAGAEAADAMAVASTSLSIDTRAGALEQAERSEGTEIGLRVLLGRRQACVSGSDLREETMATMAERAVAMARLAPEDPHCGLADPAQLAQGWDVAALDLADIGSEPEAAALQEAALACEAAAAAVPGVSQIEGTTAGFGRTRIHLAATNGFSGGYTRTGHMLSASAITGTGTAMDRDHCYEHRIYAADLPTPEEVGTRAGTRAAARSGARKPPSGRYPVLYDERAAASLIGHLLGAANGASVARGSSWLIGRMGEAILPAGLSLTEEPHCTRIPGSRPFDGEGLPTRTSAIVENGRLARWVLDLASARKLGLESTGNAARGTSAPPSPSVTNVTLTPGTASRDELLRDMGTGLLVTSLIGSTINPNTGDYSRGASGFWVENGAIAYPVHECTIAGNLLEMLPTLVPANDALQHKSHRIPSLLVESLTLAGA
ncbi:TldD/PmbA family protein [Vannielia litorea]|uniref:PmbA protein n=1 Tax=Vannielia litorea TaxID=1217970 RepID=A0A1N6HP72_9RHOB|nr:TldD/PmbA family protein [Vannielia litorea]SIO21577.1 microcin-processing peptidase 1. Unknown type peptidase. MEROPS family U62 [Vannielia litorea]